MGAGSGRQAPNDHIWGANLLRTQTAAEHLRFRANTLSNAAPRGSDVLLGDAVQIKAQGIINACSWVKQEYGIQTLERILDECSPSVRIRCTTAVAINWHPVQEFIEFLQNAELVLGSQDGHIAECIGEAGARANLKGTWMRMAFWLANPDYLMRRIAGLWQQFNDEGAMTLLHAEDTLRRVEVTGIARPNWLFCCTITGWARVTTETVGVPSPVAKHVQCRARSAERCIWEITSPPRK